MPRYASPTARRRRLAAALRELREKAGITCADLGKALGWSESKVSRIETGQSGIKANDLDSLLNYWKVDAEVREALQTLRRQSHHRGWWNSYADAFPRWFEGYAGLEDEATALTIYRQDLVPGLMQTDEYASAVIRAHRPSVTADELERLQSVRSTRQAVLTRRKPLEVWAVLDEAVLRRVVGGPAVMGEQLRHLLTVAAYPNVTLQVLPFEQGAHASMGTSFIHLQYSEAGSSDIIYIEALTSSQYLEEPDDIERYTVVSNHLRASALSPEASVAFIRRLADGPA
ncbi:helix-turn-helix domain-containing protein [Actinomadura atramentaria]|uniref:helix-turn-helix domain-containing protein n=1 Tax=Actinomadura atramentaria TaxID=1990 RepID=UPI000360FDB4|nr:helix-turn-helix transcriptional regulator [Actinomadura atramentaria]